MIDFFKKKKKEKTDSSPPKEHEESFQDIVQERVLTAEGWRRKLKREAKAPPSKPKPKK